MNENVKGAFDLDDRLFIFLFLVDAIVVKRTVVDVTTELVDGQIIGTMFI
jgi:hypothetical protein